MKPLDFPDRVVGAVLKRAAEHHGDRTFLEYRDLTMTYGEFNRSVNRCASALRDRGVGKGTKVGVMVPNSPEFLFTWFAAAKLGAIYVPVNTDYKGDILQYQLDQADVTHMVIDDRFLDRLHAVQDRLPRIQRVIVRRDEETPASGVELVDRLGREDFAELLNGDDTEPDMEVSYTDPHAISFTSGTTGPSKGVLATNCHVVTFAQDWIKANKFSEADTLYTCLPLFHAIAAWLGVVPVMLVGGRIAIAERFSASRFWDDVRTHDATVVHGIFSMVPILVKQPETPDDAKTTARCFYIGQQNEAFEKRFDCRVVEVYGATETGIVTYTPYDDERRKGSCGKANTETYDVSIVDEEDNICPPGVIGEIAVRPRQPFSMMQEYYNMPAESVAAFRNLWFHTGDNGRTDEDGYFYFVDRKNDAIRRRGENISSFEVESVVNRHPKIMECAAVAVPSELGEDDVKVVIVVRPDETLEAEELWAFCDEHMPRFWVPRFIELRDALPKTPNQKIQKYLLRSDQDAGTVYDREQASQERVARG